MAGLNAGTSFLLADTREANAGMDSSFQLAAVLVSLIVLGNAYRNSLRRRKVSSD